jgi:hypothetical protein
MPWSSAPVTFREHNQVSKGFDEVSTSFELVEIANRNSNDNSKKEGPTCAGPSQFWRMD